MAYQFDVNNTWGSVNHNGALFKLKTQMIAAGWVAKGSGDGLSAFSSTGDIITSAGAVANGFGNARAWIRLQSPSVGGTPREWIFQYIGASSIRGKYSSAAKFTGGTQNSTTTPSATDEVGFFGGGTDSSPTGGQPWPTDSTAARFHCMAGDASAGYSFYAFTYPVGGGTTSKYVFGMEHLDPSMIPAQETDPFVMWGIQNIQLQLGRAGQSALTNYGGQLKAWYHIGQFDALFAPLQTMRPMRYDLALEMANGNTPQCPINNGDEQWPIMCGRHQINVSTNLGIKGVMQNIKMHGATRVTGDTMTVASTADRIVVDDLTFPWNGSVPSV